ncbi:hypothetical protein FB45DRAFT_283515 [Roridomyces roridus]|uniref:Uncharacterized protein n=1 Tax=Roridomyces roridus TaxID=1738132 RepID=A0AAD7FY59_9AGAR|nr:hypothetical protein FB45DRAFT_283515 [Roridomyces roridus]
MKFISTISTLSCLYFTTAWGQATQIALPAANSNVRLGRNFVVQIVRPNSIEGSIEVGIAIGLLTCPTSQEATCPPPSAQLGNILYTGSFTPAFHEMGRFYQNITVTAPAEEDFFPVGRAQLAVARLHLLGAGPSPILELNSVLVNMVD